MKIIFSLMGVWVVVSIISAALWSRMSRINKREYFKEMEMSRRREERQGK